MLHNKLRPELLQKRQLQKCRVKNNRMLVMFMLTLANHYDTLNFYTKQILSALLSSLSEKS